MNKLLTTLLWASLAALGVYAARRRIIFALKTGAVVYVVLIFARLLLSLLTGGLQSEPVGEIIWPVVILLLAWLILSRVSASYAERRDRQKRLRRASGAGRPAR
jgi:hypothetical protein